MALEIRVPTLGESVVEATVGKWLKQIGDHVAPEDVVVELETDKVNVEVNANHTGVLDHIAHKEGDTVGVNELLATVSDAAGNGASAGRNAQQTAAPAAAAAADANRSRPFATPVAEKMAAENNLTCRNLRAAARTVKSPSRM